MSKSERDLTSLLEGVARRTYERVTSALDDQPPWGDLEPTAKRRIKENLLPQVMDVLEALDEQEGEESS